MVKRLPTMWKTCVQSLGWEDPLEKEMATYSSAQLVKNLPAMQETQFGPSVGKIPWRRKW